MRVLNGEKEAYKKLIQRYQKLVYFSILKIMNDQEEAKDLTQEAFISAYQSLAGFKQDSTFSTWIVRIAVNKALDYKKKKIPLPLEDPKRFNKEHDPNLDPLMELVKKESSATMHDHLLKLPDLYRQVIWAYYFEHKSYKEIASVEGVEVKTIESRLYRAKQKLKQQWKEEAKP